MATKQKSHQPMREAEVSERDSSIQRIWVGREVSEVNCVLNFNQLLCSYFLFFISCCTTVEILHLRVCQIILLN